MVEVAQTLTNGAPDTNLSQGITDWVVSLDVFTVTTSAGSGNVCKTLSQCLFQSVENLEIFNEKPALDITGSPC